MDHVVEMRKKETEVPASADDLADALYKVAKATKEALADGWQPGTDLPPILLTAVKEFGEVAESAGKLSPDAKTKPAAFAKALAMGAADGAGLWTDQ